MKISKAFEWAVLAFTLFFFACAGPAASGGATGDSGCPECGARGTLELEISGERGFVEMNPSRLADLDSVAAVGSFPAESVLAECPEKAKVCHGFSADAVDFDLSHVEDSLLSFAFPGMRREQMLEGLRIPESDSLEMRNAMRNLLNLELADGKPLSDLEPWRSRADSPMVYSAFDRTVPDSLKTAISRIAQKYNVRYLTIPVTVQVRILPKLGRSGGFEWKSLWTLWDARSGELVLLIYNEFTAKTTSRVAPERSWAMPFAERLGKALATDPRTIENH